MNWLNGVSISLLERGLDGVWARQKATLDNLANFETPGYKKKVVSFEEQLIAAVSDRKNQTRSQRSDAIRGTAPIINEVKSLTLRDDGNNVDVEAENIELARAQIQYPEYTRQLSDHFNRLRAAISGASR